MNSGGDMKKQMSIVFLIGMVGFFLLTSMPAVADDVLCGCAKIKRGALRIIDCGGQCLKSEFPVVLSGTAQQNQNQGNPGKGKMPCIIDAPGSFQCSAGADAVSCSWNALEEATKYAFEIVFEVPLSSDPSATQEVTFEAGTSETIITITFTELQALLDTYGETLSGQSAVAKVKGLNPPQKGACSQANTFAESQLQF
jgi:hypothetical protein